MKNNSNLVQNGFLSKLDHFNKRTKLQCMRLVNELWSILKSYLQLLETVHIIVVTPEYYKY